MMLYDWITTQIMPLFCDLNKVVFAISGNIDFVLTGFNIFNFFFYTFTAFVWCQILVVMPYKACKRLICGKSRGKRL